ncbi:hypothetical protein K3N28_05840 [Glycomyces sp. TRM65418]|uniref:hypothetical protein n=1 Tax=Glycomyces sp. TRM65418 TaxID=2867006 RepID=UPI001CE4F2D6|nr:hypothetical protein [Glycomyces sp. TRM65418]MCC3762590.1 hypothetical protein [Glycomyces sp. TRM65418]QZD56629.1 hypothetical protein K3N28_05800 [Glycomyces sp. TRM65418]
MGQVGVGLSGLAIAIVLWRIADVLEPANALAAGKSRRMQWWALTGVSMASLVSAVAMAHVAPLRPASVAFVLLAAAAPGLASIDVRSMLLPFPILAVLAVAALAQFSIDAWWSGSAGRLGQAVLSGLVVAVLGWMWWKAAGDTVGLGDVALLGVVALYLGWFSITAVWAGLVIACLLASMSLLLSRIGREPKASLVPMGPPILAGWWVATALAAAGGG